MTNFHGDQRKKNLKWPNHKKWIFQNFQFSKCFCENWICPWVSRIDWCKGLWCGSTYMVERLPQNRQKMHFFMLLGCSCSYVQQPQNHICWATPLPFASINSTNPRTNPWNLQKKNWELVILKNLFVLFESTIL